MDWKGKIKDECCADELEEMIVDQIKAGFWSNDKLLMECEQYIKDFYRDECSNITKEDLTEIIKVLREEYQNTGDQKNFLKLDSVFGSLREQKIVTMHYAGCTQSDGFADCNGVAEWLEDQGVKMIGCCFYTEQDLGHILHGDSTLLYLSFGNYFEEPTAKEVGQIIADELKAAGFCVEWNGSEETKIAIKDFRWDKCYTDGE